jgi:hypothetical protein
MAENRGMTEKRDFSLLRSGFFFFESDLEAGGQQ